MTCHPGLKCLFIQVRLVQMNDTIEVNCETIAGMLSMDTQANSDVEEDLDDIFDF